MNNEATGIESAELVTLIVLCLRQFYRRRMTVMGQVRLVDFRNSNKARMLKALDIGTASDVVAHLMADHVVESEQRIFASVFREPAELMAARGAYDKEGRRVACAAVSERLFKLHERVDAILGHAERQDITRICRDVSEAIFWMELSGDPNFYSLLVRLMRRKSLRHKTKYAHAWHAAVNRLALQFITTYCSADGRILWTEALRTRQSPKLSAGSYR